MVVVVVLCSYVKIIHPVLPSLLLPHSYLIHNLKTSYTIDKAPIVPSYFLLGSILPFFFFLLMPILPCFLQNLINWLGIT